MIIGVVGFIGSGKGTVADILVDSYGFQKISFADSLKDAVSAVFGWPRYMLEGDTDASREFREQVDQWWADKLHMPDLTPRVVLQKWGTEVCRDGWHQDIWIASLERKLTDDKNYVIPDTRFPNEIKMINRLGGQVWQIKRGENPNWYDQYKLGGSPPKDVHPSEWSWIRSKYDHTIENNGSFDDLKDKISSLL
jgi:hypothetical protein